MKTRTCLQSLFLLYVTFGLIVTSCTPTYYAPGTMPSPGLQKKNDVKLAVHKTDSYDDNSISQGKGFDLEMAYSPVENIGIVYHSNSFSDGFSNPVGSRPGPYGIPIYEYKKYVSRGSIHNFGLGYYKNISVK